MAHGPISGEHPVFVDLPDRGARLHGRAERGDFWEVTDGDAIAFKP